MIHQTFSSLIQGIENELKNIANGYVTRRSEEEYRHVISEQFYAKHSGNYSVGSLLNSVETVSGMDGTDIAIITHHNQAKFTQTYPSLVDGFPQDNRDNIIHWLNYGTDGSPIYNFAPSNFLQEGDRKLKENTADWCVMGLKSKGIQAYK